VIKQREVEVLVDIKIDKLVEDMRREIEEFIRNYGKLTAEASMSRIDLECIFLYHTLEVRRSWDLGDVIELSMPMLVSLIPSTCHLQYMRGSHKVRPLVYCLEQVDKPRHDVWDLAIPLDAKLEAQYDPPRPARRYHAHQRRSLHAG